MSLFTPLASVFADLEKDLAAPGGPRISTMRNHSMCILQYPPEQEWELRQLLRGCASRMAAQGWQVHTLDLFELLLERLETHEPGFLEQLAQREARIAKKDRDRAMAWVGDKLARHLGDDGGIVVDILREMQARIPQDQRDHSVVFLGRLGALYPYFRSSALLRQLDQRTHGVPVVLLYPGEHRGGGLSFMGQFEPDRDYRPRIYSTRKA